MNQPNPIAFVRLHPAGDAWIVPSCVFCGCLHRHSRYPEEPTGPGEVVGVRAGSCGLGTYRMIHREQTREERIRNAAYYYIARKGGDA